MVNLLLAFAAGAVAGPLALVGLVYWLARRRMARLELDPPWVPTGDVVPLDWTVRTLDDQAVAVGDLAGDRVLVLNFWATWCPPCVAEVPSIDALFARLNDRVAFVCVSQEDPATLRRFRDAHGVRFPVYSREADPPPAFDAPGVPATFLIAKGRTVVLRHVGGADWAHESVARYLEALAG